MSEKNVGKYLDETTWDALKAAGFTEEELQKDQPFGPMIACYSRKQAIEDGVLVDLTRPGFKRVLDLERVKIHAAMTDTAFATVVSNDIEHDDLWQALCRLGRVLRAMNVASSKVKERTDRVFFEVPTIEDAIGDEPVKMWAMCGPGDDAEPVLTIMLEGED